MLKGQTDAKRAKTPNVVQTISFGHRPNSIRRKTARTLLIKDYANSLTNTNKPLFLLTPTLKFILIFSENIFISSFGGFQPFGVFWSEGSLLKFFFLPCGHGASI